MIEKESVFNLILMQLGCDEFSIPPNPKKYSNIVWYKETKKCSESDFNSALAEYEANQYQRDRADAFPSYADQFDTIYHQGIDAWKAEIKKVKNAHPKPSE